jgi:adhesin HecA-like repeat protein
VITTTTGLGTNPKVISGNSLTIKDQYASSTNRVIERLGTYYGQSNSVNQIKSIDKSFEGLISAGEFNYYQIADTFQTSEDITNQTDLKVKGNLLNAHTLTNNGTLTFNKGSSIDNTGGTLQNNASKQIKFNESINLEGNVINNGIINIADNEQLKLTGNLSGNGQYNGATLLDNANIIPGNIPGTLTFSDSIWDDVSLTMEISSDGNGGFAYNHIDILGDLTLLSDFSLDFTYLDHLSAIDLIGESFNFLSVAGSVLDSQLLTIDFDSWDLMLDEGWSAIWQAGSISGWDLNLSYAAISNDSNSPTAVPEPSSLWLILMGAMSLLFFRIKQSNTGYPS